MSLLRREAGLSQKTAAAELGISQALLSHYETGAREPGLAFLVRAGDFYRVSADYLLGRTMLRDGAAVQAEELHDAAGDKDNRLGGVSASSLLGKKLLVNATGLIFDLLGRSGDTALTSAVSAYVGTALYKIFRYLYSAAGSGANKYFPVPAESFSEAANADMAVSEARIKALLSSKEPLSLPSLSDDSLRGEYPLLAQSLLTITHQAAARSAKLL
jgi:transcriptional regulator with XRE-family HTH domain